MFTKDIVYLHGSGLKVLEKYLLNYFFLIVCWHNSSTFVWLF